MSAIGAGTWALGGPFKFHGRDAGWGEVDDDESSRALHAAFDVGITLIDTAPTDGIGHSELIIGRALATWPGDSDKITVATKFGLVYDEQRRVVGGTDVSRAAIRAGCAASLRRLGIDSTGVYQLHNGADGPAQAEEIVATCEELVADGKICHLGTAQDVPEIIEVFARSANCVSIQTQVNVFGWTAASLDAARSAGLAFLARSPLAMGMLTGKYSPSQGALCYLLAVDPAIIPLPGIRTEAQAIENAGALAQGPLPVEAATEITELLADSPERH